MTFTLDTTDRVSCTDPSKPCICHASTWDRVPPIAQGFLHEAFASLPHGPGMAVYPLGSVMPAGFRHLSQEALQLALADCVAFLNEPGVIGADRPINNTVEDGRGFWLQRSSGWPAWPLMRDRLAEKYPPLTFSMDGVGKMQFHAPKGRA
jgi:hypothetical protein